MAFPSTLALCVLSQLAATAPTSAPVPGVEGSSSATLPVKPPDLSGGDPTFYRRKKAPPTTPAAAGEADLRGLTALGEGNCEAAIAAYDEALAIAPGTASYLFNRGQCLARVGRVDEAIRDLDAAVKADPELAQVGEEARVHVRVTRGGARLEAGDPAGALGDFVAARKLDPKSALAWSEEAVALAQLARPKECVVAATKALQLAPRRAEALITRASCLARLERRAEALEDLSAVISIAPRGEAYASRAFMHLEAGHLGPAKRDAREAVRLDPRLEPLLQRVLDAGP